MTNQFKDFKISSVVGKGGMGTVFDVVRSGERRALKQMPLSSLKGDLTALKNARIETRTMDHFVRHPNIVQIYSAFEDFAFSLSSDGSVVLSDSEKSIYIEMELCTGGTLRRKIDQYREAGQFFGEQQIMHWFTDLALAVKYLHDDGIIHRDIKSQDIFLGGSANEIKLGAFGLALANENLAGINMMGTVAHMPPEALNAKHDYRPTPKEDIWALGVLLYELAALELPFQGSNQVEITASIQNGKMKPLSADKYSAEFRRLVEKMLTPNPGNRMDAKALIHDEYVFLCAERKLQEEA